MGPHSYSQWKEVYSRMGLISLRLQKLLPPARTSSFTPYDAPLFRSLRVPTIAGASVDTMNTLVDTIRRFSSEPVIASSSELGSLLFEFSAARSSFLSEERFLRKRPAIHLLSLGFSPGRRQDLPGSGSGVPTSAASTVEIQGLGFSFFFDRCSGGASLLLDSSPAANLFSLAPVLKLSTCGEESGSKGETHSTSPGRKSLMESELAPILPRSGDATGPAYAIASCGNKDTPKMTAALSTGSVEEKQYVWADKYRPISLTKFICNRDKAQELHQMVCLSASQSCVPFHSGSKLKQDLLLLSNPLMHIHVKILIYRLLSSQPKRNS